MKTDPNEPIYPDKEYGNSGATGLIKREYFAAMAMQTMDFKYYDIQEMVENSVKLADALIVELNK